MITDFALKLSIITTLVKLSDKYTNDKKNNYTWEDLDGQDKSLILALGVSYIGLWIYSIADAYQSAIDYNALYIEYPRVSINLDINEKRQTIMGLSLRF